MTLKIVRFAPLIFIAVASGCASPDPWSPEFSPPTVLETDRMRLEPLAPKHAELDHAAAQSSREHLQRTLHWGSWPRPDMTVDENRRDLVRHWTEFEERKGYAFTVLRPDRAKCLGCVYLSPDKENRTETNLAYWVIEDELATDLDTHLLTSTLNWIRTKWPIKTIAMSLHKENKRGIRIAEDLGLGRREQSDAEHVTFVWQSQ